MSDKATPAESSMAELSLAFLKSAQLHHADIFFNEEENPVIEYETIGAGGIFAYRKTLLLNPVTYRGMQLEPTDLADVILGIRSEPEETKNPLDVEIYLSPRKYLVYQQHTATPLLSGIYTVTDITGKPLFRVEWNHKRA